MRWAILLLVLANLGVTSYLVLIDRGEAPAVDVRKLEMNADKVLLLKHAGNDAKTACLEWSSLGEPDLARAQAELARLRPGRTSVRDRSIYIADPSPAIVARLAELRAAFPGSELRAVACLPDAP